MAIKRGFIKKMKIEVKKDKVLLLEAVLSFFILSLVIILTVISLLMPKYRVTFNSNGGTAITSKIVKCGKSIAPPMEPTKAGYIFKGWYYNDELYLFDEGVNDDIELVAKWEVIEKEQIQSIDITAQNFSMLPNKTLKIPYEITPLLEEKIFWESSDPIVVEVDDDGNITSKEEGTATIKVTTLNGLSDEVKVAVDKDSVLLENIFLETDEIFIEKGTVKQLNIFFLPENASNKNVLWFSDDTSIVIVDSNGVINAKKEGEAIIVATSLERNKTVRCKVTVTGV